MALGVLESVAKPVAGMQPSEDGRYTGVCRGSRVGAEGAEPGQEGMTEAVRRREPGRGDLREGPQEHPRQVWAEGSPGHWGTGCRQAPAPSHAVGRPGQVGRKAADVRAAEGTGPGLCGPGLWAALSPLPNPSMQTLPQHAHLSALPRISTACRVRWGCPAPAPNHNTGHLKNSQGHRGNMQGSRTPRHHLA